MMEYTRSVSEVIGSRAVLLVMCCVGGSHAPPSISEIAKHTYLGLKNTSRAVKLLRKRGWLAVEEDMEDTRKRRIVLTPTGERALRLATAFAQQAADRLHKK